MKAPVPCPLLVSTTLIHSGTAWEARAEHNLELLSGYQYKHNMKFNIKQTSLLYHTSYQVNLMGTGPCVPVFVRVVFICLMSALCNPIYLFCHQFTSCCVTVKHALCLHWGWQCKRGLLLHLRGS
jgi:hypothetical protein